MQSLWLLMSCWGVQGIGWRQKPFPLSLPFLQQEGPHAGPELVITACAKVLGLVTAPSF